MDDLVVQEQTQTEESDRAATFDEIQKKGAEDVPYIPLYTDAPFAYYQKGELTRRRTRWTSSSRSAGS